MSDTVVAIVSAFFVIGILVGIVVVIAMAVIRAGRHGRPDDPADPQDYQPRGPVSRHRASPGTAPSRTATRAGRGMTIPISAAGRAALGEEKLPRVPGRGRGARQHPAHADHADVGWRF